MGSADSALHNSVNGGRPGRPKLPGACPEHLTPDARTDDPGRRRRWELLATAQAALGDREPHTRDDGTATLRYVYRVAQCQRDTNFAVECRTSPDFTSLGFSGVMTCGSPWHCPVCSAEIARERRDRIRLMRARWMVGQGGDVSFITYTASHGRGDAGPGMLAEFLPRFAAALRSLKAQRQYRRMLEGLDAAGVIRGLEVTYGERNGWHPHTHELLFHRRSLATRDGRLRMGRYSYLHTPAAGLRKLWARELVKAGLAGLRPDMTLAERRRQLRHVLTHCCTIQPGSYADDYTAKFGRLPEAHRGTWTVDDELTRTHLKTRRGPGYAWRRLDHANPWELLNDAADGDAVSADLWREFGIAFHGRRQLYTSPGLAELLEVETPDDETTAAEPAKRQTVVVASLTDRQWELTLAHGLRYDVLLAAARGGQPFVDSLLAYLDVGNPDAPGGEFSRVLPFRARAAPEPGSWLPVPPEQRPTAERVAAARAEVAAALAQIPGGKV